MLSWLDRRKQLVTEGTVNILGIGLLKAPFPMNKNAIIHVSDRLSISEPVSGSLSTKQKLDFDAVVYYHQNIVTLVAANHAKGTFPLSPPVSFSGSRKRLRHPGRSSAAIVQRKHIPSLRYCFALLDSISVAEVLGDR